VAPPNENPFTKVDGFLLYNTLKHGIILSVIFLEVR